jgi:hypothetical protein
MADDKTYKKSVKLGDKDYALVPARLKQMREENPRASVDTEPTYNADGSITFKAIIIRDQSDPYSAKASGTARYTAEELKKPKQFEKLETVAIGRALAVLGYLNDGQIASTEEMEEFHAAKEAAEKERVAGEIAAVIERIEAATTNDELNAAVQSAGSVLKYQEVIEAGKKRRAELKAPEKPVERDPDETRPTEEAPDADS